MRGLKPDTPALLDDEELEAMREQVDQIAETLTLLGLLLLYVHRGDG